MRRFRQWNYVVFTVVELSTTQYAELEGIFAVSILQLAVRQTAVDGIPRFVRLD